MAADPSQAVQEHLLPHVHLINTFRYALMPRVELADVTKWLLAAPKIARDTAPFFWTFLDCPQDGMIMLTWQPLQRLGTDFASDGYVWATAETFFQQEVGNGLILEIYYQRVGYRPGEQIASHSRRRFRLTPPKVATQNTAQVDPSLWVVHYGPSDDRVPVSQIPYDPRTHVIMNQRMTLQRAGQIARKEFMLSDRVNWPQIPLPREARGQPLYGAPPNPRGVPQQMAYPPHAAGNVGHPSKRPRHAPGGVPQQQPMVGGMALVESAYEDDEDTSRGDMFDHMSPREFSMARYQQNHEWMEELISSPYRFGQIVHVDLGLGLKGELSSVSDGIFEAQGSDAAVDGPKKPYVGRLDPGQADEFRNRVTEKIESTKAEIAKMEADHAKMVAKFKTNSLLKHAEQDLRGCVQDTGSEFWRLEGRQEDGEDGLGRWSQKYQKTLEDIVVTIEASLGQRAEVVHDVFRVQDGGFQEPAPEPIPEPVAQAPAAQAEPAAAARVSSSMSRGPSQSGSQDSGLMIGDSDMDMGGTAAGLLDQMHTGFSSTSTPINNFPTPQAHLSAIPSSAATPAMLSAPSPQNHPAPIQEHAMEDVAMEGADTKDATEASTSAAGAVDREWVVVPHGGVSPDVSASANAGMAAQSTDDQTPTREPIPPATATSKPASEAPTPAMADSESVAFDADNNDFSSLGDLDTAGDALAGYDPPTLDGTGGDLGDHLELNMGDMDDSAFGDAFHGVNESREGGGDSPLDGGL